jgi:hypothetical protein
MGTSASDGLTRHMEVIVKWLLLSLAVIAIAAVLISTVMARRRANRLIRPAEILEPGWQFTAKPTSSALERPGTVFRIDRQRRRYLVERLPVPVVAAREADEWVCAVQAETSAPTDGSLTGNDN